MNTLTKGAFAMVLAGSVTFSVTSALLVERLTEEHALAVFGNQKKRYVISQAEKTVKAQTSKTNGKGDETKLSQKALKISNKNNMEAAATQQNTKKISKSTATTTSKVKETTTTAALKTTSVASTKAPTTKATSTQTETKAPTTKATSTQTGTKAPTIHEASEKAPMATTKPTPAGTNTKDAASSTINPGQEVSQAAKEKAVSDQDKKENNGKKR
ncbi:hypothetical protein DFO73_10252 [Cytobacillus oceanisediminis]|jgi:hypothetical protein|uniref:Uncharacterized protein n=1 Tax=Cytobacillus oceanisediminis TaxID=665099 RepID=A0A2V3A354_9BACI|nr:hypothetical protein [Cytobacillus oceanisediminis]PWW31058.1 hypothetical protein DFO73_10252 [Cytobacillus oceanisediminis]